MSDYTPEPLTKRCTKCHRELPQSEFAKDKTKKDGLYSSCKACVYETHKKERLDHPGRIAARDKITRDARKDIMNERRRNKYWENPEPFRERSRNARNKNVIVIRIKDRDRHIKNKDMRNSKMREYQRKNPHIVKAAGQRRAALKKGLPNNFTASDWLNAVEYFNGCCAVCGYRPDAIRKIAADHWIPLSSQDCPGTIPENIIPLCHGRGGCNNSKKNSPASEWIRSRYEASIADKILERIGAFLDNLKTTVT